jgi:nitrile hydratase
MNGLHDLGGLTCFGPVEREEDEPVFHGNWERRVFALTVASSATEFSPIDMRRFELEKLEPIHYLEASYYERWLDRLETLAREAGLVTEEEMATGIASASAGRAEPPVDAARMEALIRRGWPANRDTGRLQARFAVGDRVRARNLNPPGHTRLPRYARGRAGVIDRIHGTHCFPDTNAHGKGENPQPLYSVQFAATELWGPAAPAGDHLYVDLWEDYLDAEDG